MDGPTVFLGVVAVASFSIIVLSWSRIIQRHKIDVFLKRYELELARLIVAFKKLAGVFDQFSISADEAAAKISAFGKAFGPR